jgi:VIT1/CCC1 family predicted Fe2+/Mn2+ transporter
MKQPLLYEAAAPTVASSVGMILQLVAILHPLAVVRVPITFGSVVVALSVTDAVSARLGGSPLRPAAIRLMVGGALGMAVTFGIGDLFNATMV